MRLKDRVAIVTGASSGIGKAVLERFVQEGAKVVANSSSKKGLAVCEELKERGFEVEFCQLDVSLVDELPGMVRFAEERFGKLDILVNNAGIETAVSVLDMTYEDWRRVHQVNLEGIFFLSQAAARVMKKSRYGRIVNMSSIQGLVGAANCSHYAATKAAILQLTRSFAIELADDNIMVNAIAPGVIHTPMSFVAGVDETTTESFQEVYVRQGKIPLRRPGRAEEVASSTLFLASDECQYMTGQTLVVDGGLTITW